MYDYVRGAFVDIGESLKTFRLSHFESSNDYGMGRDFIKVHFRCQDPGGKLSADAAVEALNAIQGFFFTFKDKPRELSAEVRVPSRCTMDMTVKWSYVTDGWSRTLPFDMPMVPNLFNCQLQVYIFGKDLELSQRHEVMRNLDSGIIFQLRRETASLPPGVRDVISKNSYSANGVTVQVEKVDQGKYDVDMECHELGFFCWTYVKWLMRPNTVPREFGARIISSRHGGQHLFNIFFLFTDLDSIEPN